MMIIDRQTITIIWIESGVNHNLKGKRWRRRKDFAFAFVLMYSGHAKSVHANTGDHGGSQGLQHRM